MSRWLSRRGVNKAILSRVLQRRACSTYRSNEHTMYRSYETWRTLPRRPTLDLIPARAHTPCVSPGGNYDSIRRVNGIVWIGRVSARLWYYSEEQMESCRPFVWSSYSFNFRTWERERKKQRGGGGMVIEDACVRRSKERRLGGDAHGNGNARRLPNRGEIISARARLFELLSE